jgi:O-acetyl-ADP-ribose deacetylase (regulator of RNase III)
MASLKSVNTDITTVEVDAIVNAANNSLLGGGGVDGAIHRAAGPELLAACSRLNGCETGSAVITGAFNLPCRYVIHTVGPIWSGGGNNETLALSSCYESCMRIADLYGVESIAFPAISCGVYGFPIPEAVEIAVNTVGDYCNRRQCSIQSVLFVCFGHEMQVAYERAFADI